MKPELTLSSLLLFLTVSLATLNPLAELVAIEAGDAAPAFEAATLDGATCRSADYAGKVIVLEWTHYGCPFVGKLYESDKLPALQRRFAKRDVVWFTVASGLSADADLLANHEFAEKRHVEAVLLDTDGSLAKAFGARTAPHLYVIDSEGVIAYEGAVDDNRSTDLDQANQGRNYLAEALKAVLAGKRPEVAAAKPYGCAIKYD